MKGARASTRLREACGRSPHGWEHHHTANGELTSKTVGTNVTSYTYDALGNLLHVGFSAALGDGTTAVDYLVDAQNRRVGRKVNGTLVSGWLYQDPLRPIAQVDGSGTNVIARFVYGSKANVPDYMVTSGGTYRILSDHLGSPRLVVDANSGAIIENNSYDEFGNETPTHGTLPTGYVLIPFGFAGGLYDPDTTLVRFGARDYDASVGRWTSKDPIRFRSRENNLYGYVFNDPVDGTDARGTAPFCNYSSQPVLVGGGTGPGNGHTGGFGTGYVMPGQCVGAGSPLPTPAGPLTDVDVVDFNGDGTVQPPMSWRDTWPLGEKIVGPDTGPVCTVVNNPLPVGNPIIPEPGGWWPLPEPENDPTLVQ